MHEESTGKNFMLLSLDYILMQIILTRKESQVVPIHSTSYNVECKG